ncbi:MAG TPA: septation protein SepH [Nocardioidaceae bacterium]|nr:septation protein SepH [Nocardioidaceae bacterium]
MVELRLVGLSEDRHRLVLTDSVGQEFTVAVDDRLRAALRGDRARLGPLEVQMDSALRPRDIQARIRAGDSPEAVAEVAQVPVDKIMSYAVPVLAERQHMADRALRSGVRRKGGEGPGRLLGDLVADRLRSDNVDPDSAGWDAWRREDGKWTVTVTHAAGGAEQTGTFTFDTLGRYATADDDAARWLLGEVTPESAGPQQGRPARRLSAVAGAVEDDAPLPFDEYGQPFGGYDRAVDDLTPETTEPEPAVETRPDDLGGEDAEAGAGAGPEAGPEADPGADVEHPAAEEEPRRRSRKSRGRASVPSWDEIMFGRTKE